MQPASGSATSSRCPSRPTTLRLLAIGGIIGLAAARRREREVTGPLRPRKPSRRRDGPVVAMNSTTVSCSGRKLSCSGRRSSMIRDLAVWRSRIPGGCAFEIMAKKQTADKQHTEKCDDPKGDHTCRDEGRSHDCGSLSLSLPCWRASYRLPLPSRVTNARAIRLRTRSIGCIFVSEVELWVGLQLLRGRESPA